MLIGGGKLYWRMYIYFADFVRAFANSVRAYPYSLQSLFVPVRNHCKVPLCLYIATAKFACVRLYGRFFHSFKLETTEARV